MKLLSDIQHRIKSIDSETEIEVYWTNNVVYLKFKKPTDVFNSEYVYVGSMRPRPRMR